MKIDNKKIPRFQVKTVKTMNNRIKLKKTKMKMDSQLP